MRQQTIWQGQKPELIETRPAVRYTSSAAARSGPHPESPRGGNASRCRRVGSGYPQAAPSLDHLKDRPKHLRVSDLWETCELAVRRIMAETKLTEGQEVALEAFASRCGTLRAYASRKRLDLVETALGRPLTAKEIRRRRGNVGRAVVRTDGRWV